MALTSHKSVLAHEALMSPPDLCQVHKKIKGSQLRIVDECLAIYKALSLKMWARLIVPSLGISDLRLTMSRLPSGSGVR